MLRLILARSQIFFKDSVYLTLKSPTARYNPHFASIVEVNISLGANCHINGEKIR